MTNFNFVQKNNYVSRQWYTNDKRAGGTKNSDYTPQNKPAEKLISSYFGR